MVFLCQRNKFTLYMWSSTNSEVIFKLYSFVITKFSTWCCDSKSGKVGEGEDPRVSDSYKCKSVEMYLEGK